MSDDQKRNSKGHAYPESECSTTSLHSVAGFGRDYTFKFKELRGFLSTITAQIDLPAVALILASHEVIELHLAQELLQFTGGVREKGVKVLEIFNQLQRQEDKVPFFLRSLLESGDSSPTNMELYENLSQGMVFFDRDVEDACKKEVRRRSLGRSRNPKMKKSSGSASSGIESSTSSIRKFSSPQPSYVHMMSDSMLSYDATPPHALHTDSMLTKLQEENDKLQEEVGRLHKMIGWSFNLLTETQKELVTTKNQIKALYRSRYDHDPIDSRRISSHIISPPTEGRIRKISRSLDSIQHELMILRLNEQPALPEMSQPRIPSAMLSPRLHAKTSKGRHK